MEVHHHSHSPETPEPHKKKWIHLLREFLMLFLAVFCGFLAENYREHQIELRREKEYIHSLIADLKNDQTVLANHINDMQSGTRMMDTLINLLNKPADISNNTGTLYYLARLGPRLNPLSINTRTFEQLKNSGNFRLVRDINTSNQIMAYYEKVPIVRLLETMGETEFTEYKKVASKVFSPAIFLQMERPDGKIMRSNDNPPLRTNDIEFLQELSVFAVYLHGTKTGITAASNDLKDTGKKLLEYLQKEYHTE